MSLKSIEQRRLKKNRFLRWINVRKCDKYRLFVVKGRRNQLPSLELLVGHGGGIGGGSSVASPVSSDVDRRVGARRCAGEVGVAEPPRGVGAAVAAGETAGSGVSATLLGDNGGSQVQAQRLLLDLREKPLQGRRGQRQCKARAARVRVRVKQREWRRRRRRRDLEMHYVWV